VFPAGSEIAHSAGKSALVQVIISLHVENAEGPEADSQRQSKSDTAPACMETILLVRRGGVPRGRGVGGIREFE
jgi:hypothetical protein